MISSYIDQTFNNSTHILNIQFGLKFSTYILYVVFFSTIQSFNSSMEKKQLWVKLYVDILHYPYFKYKLTQRHPIFLYSSIFYIQTSNKYFSLHNML